MITICGSLSFYDEMIEIRAKLMELGIISELPELYEAGIEKVDGEVLVESIEYNKYICSHLAKIKDSSGILIANYAKNCIDGYVGANTLVEAAFAYALNKRIYLFNAMGKQSSRDVMLGMLPVQLFCDLTRLTLDK